MQSFILEWGQGTCTSRKHNVYLLVFIFSPTEIIFIGAERTTVTAVTYPAATTGVCLFNQSVRNSLHQIISTIDIVHSATLKIAASPSL